jgi:hypothetical protein
MPKKRLLFGLSSGNCLFGNQEYADGYCNQDYGAYWREGAGGFVA